MMGFSLGSVRKKRIRICLSPGVLEVTAGNAIVMKMFIKYLDLCIPPSSTAKWSKQTSKQRSEGAFQFQKLTTNHVLRVSSENPLIAPISTECELLIRVIRSCKRTIWQNLYLFVCLVPKSDHQDLHRYSVYLRWRRPHAFCKNTEKNQYDIEHILACPGRVWSRIKITDVHAVTLCGRRFRCFVSSNVYLLFPLSSILRRLRADFTYVAFVLRSVSCGA